MTARMTGLPPKNTHRECLIGPAGRIWSGDEIEFARKSLLHDGLQNQFEIAIWSFCVPALPPRENVTGTLSLAGTGGMTTLNW